MKLALAVSHTAWKGKTAMLRGVIRQAAAAALAHAGKKDAALSVALVGNAEMQRLNHDFRGKKKPTNVLAFPSGEANYLGDIAIALDVVTGEAKAQDKGFRDHLSHLTVHAVLHLLGRDHRIAAEAEAMEQEEVLILQRLNISNPYL